MGIVDEGDSSAEGTPSKKPFLPAFLFLGLGLWVGIYVSYVPIRHISPDIYEAFFLFCSGGAFAVGLCLFKKGNRFPLAFLIGVLLGGSCGLVQGHLMKTAAHVLEKENQGSYRFEVVEDVQLGDFGSSCVAETMLTGGRVVRVKIYFKDTSPIVSFGDIFCASTTLRGTHDVAHDTYWQQGIVATASVGKIEPVVRNDAKGVLLSFRKAALSLFDGYEGEGVALLRAILFGERTMLNTYKDFYSEIKVAGLAHIVAVSGAHLVIVTTLFGIVLYASPLPKTFTIFIQAVFVLIYLVCAGVPLSALRAACMTLVVMFSLFARRSASSVNALGVCLILILVSTPIAATSISLMLSAGATLGILLFSRLFSDWIVYRGSLPVFVSDSLAMTFSSGVFTTFVCAAAFSQVSLISPLSNVLAAPLFSLACGGGLFCVLLVILVPPLGPPVLGFLIIGAQLCAEGIGILARIPFAAVPFSLDMSFALMMSVVLGCILWIAWPRPSGKAFFLGGSSAVCLVAFVLLLGSSTGRYHEVIMLDVGQGDAFIIRSEGSVILVDTGNQTNKLLAGLARHNIYELDAVLVSHADDDHCGSLGALQGVVTVKSVLLANDALSCHCGSCGNLVNTASRLVGEEGIVPLSVGDCISVGAFVYEVVWPYSFVDEGGNADSLTGMVYADINHDNLFDWKMLFCGDLEANQIKEISEENNVEELDVLKVGHHGSRAALDVATVQTLSPEIALISAGENNRYGHPTSEILALLEQEGSQVFRTDEHGDVVCRVYQNRILASAMR